MDVRNAIQGRRSVRDYESREVEEDKLMKVLDAGRLSPSAGNRQERRFVVVSEWISIGRTAPDISKKPG